MTAVKKAEADGVGQFELSLFMDLSQFDELERRVSHLIERQEKLRAENEDLRSRIAALEEQVRQKSAEAQSLLAERDDLLSRQRDLKKEELIRRKITDLLEKLEGV